VTKPSGSRVSEFSTHEELVVLVCTLLERVAILEAENAVLKQENALLKAKNLRLQEELRAGKRPTAPSTKGTPRDGPK
jgi:hypothetical protein